MNNLYIDESGLVKFGARDYDPMLGRWLEADPIGFGAGVTNLYEYAKNDPINYIDPEGTTVKDVINHYIQLVGGILASNPGWCATGAPFLNKLIKISNLQIRRAQLEDELQAIIDKEHKKSCDSNVNKGKQLLKQIQEISANIDELIDSIGDYDLKVIDQCLNPRPDKGL